MSYGVFLRSTTNPHLGTRRLPRGSRCQAISGSDPPDCLTRDYDPTFKSHRWQANLRILEVSDIKPAPYAPISRPFIERLIGTIRHEHLDHTPFWNAIDLARQLDDFKDY